MRRIVAEFLAVVTLLYALGNAAFITAGVPWLISIGKRDSILGSYLLTWYFLPEFTVAIPAVVSATWVVYAYRRGWTRLVVTVVTFLVSLGIIAAGSWLPGIRPQIGVMNMSIWVPVTHAVVALLVPTLRLVRRVGGQPPRQQQGGIPGPHSSG